MHNIFVCQPNYTINTIYRYPPTATPSPYFCVVRETLYDRNRSPDTGDDFALRLPIHRSASFSTQQIMIRSKMSRSRISQVNRLQASKGQIQKYPCQPVLQAVWLWDLIIVIPARESKCSKERNWKPMHGMTKDRIIRKRHNNKLLNVHLLRSMAKAVGSHSPPFHPSVVKKLRTLETIFSRRWLKTAPTISKRQHYIHSCLTWLWPTAFRSGPSASNLMTHPWDIGQRYDLLFREYNIVAKLC